VLIKIIYEDTIAFHFTFHYIRKKTGISRKRGIYCHGAGASHSRKVKDNQMKKLLFLIFFAGLSFSCASLPVMPTAQNHAGGSDQVNAENRMMKKNLELALRENEVVKTENARYKSQVKKLKKEVSSLNDDLASLTLKYDEDTTRLNDEITRINESYDILVNDFTRADEENRQAISELTSQNTGLQKQLADETDRLNTAIKDQKALFDAQLKASQEELTAMKAGCVERETALQNRLTASKQAAAEKDAAIKTLEQTRQEALNKVTDLEKTIQEQIKKIQGLEKTNQEHLPGKKPGQP